jgi:hypothetical protein
LKLTGQAACRETRSKHDVPGCRQPVSDRSEGEGWFEFSHLEPGDYEIWCGEPPRPPVQRFHIPEGASTDDVSVQDLVLRQ